MSNKRVGELLRTCRKYAKLSQSELGGEVGLHGSSISLIENGKNPLRFEYCAVIVEELERRGVPSDILIQLQEAVDNSNPITTLDDLDSAALVIAKQKEQLTLGQSKELDSKIFNLIHINKELIRAQQNCIERQSDDAVERLEGISRDVRSYVGGIELTYHITYAQALYHKGLFQQAVDSLRKALFLSQEIHGENSEETARVNMKTGDSLRHLSEWETARKSYDTARTIYTQLGDGLGQADALRKIIGVYLFESRPTTALQHCNDCIVLSRNAKCYKRTSQALAHKAWALRLLGKWQESEKLILEAMDYTNKINFKNDLEKTDVYLKLYRYLGDTYRVQRKYKEALSAYELAEFQVDQLEEMGIGTTLHAGMVWLGIGQIYAKTGGLAKAEEYLSKSLDLHRKYGKDFLLSNAQQELGALQIELQEFSDADQLLEEALFHLQRVKNHYHYAKCLVDLCNLHCKRGELQKIQERERQIQTLHAALSQTNESEILLMHRSKIQLILAEYHITQGIREQAITHFIGSIRIALEHGELGFCDQIMEGILDIVNSFIKVRDYERATLITRSLSDFWKHPHADTAAGRALSMYFAEFEKMSGDMARFGQKLV